MCKYSGSNEKKSGYQDEYSDDSENKEAIPENESLLTTLTRKTEETQYITGIVIGTIVDIDETGAPLVDFNCNMSGKPLLAKAVLEINKSHSGRDVALMFEENSVHKPIVMGLMHIPGSATKIIVDGKTETITAEKELLLQCGQSSILLKENGKIVIKGRDIISRARRNNKIRGGSVQLN